MDIHRSDGRPWRAFVVIALTLVGIPALMILLSVARPARANRTLNLVVASLCIPIAAFNVVSQAFVPSPGRLRLTRHRG